MNSKSPSFIINIKKQIIRILPVVFISIALALGGAAATVFIARLTNNPIWKLAKDPAQVIGFEPYIGLLSNWGALLWVSAGVICLFASLAMKNQHASFRAYRFLFASGILSFLLAVDDIFLLHDEVLPRLLDMPEFFFYLIYVIIFGSYLLYFRRDISKYDYLLFMAAFMLLLVSRGFFLPRVLRGYMTTNDMLKYFGIVFWLAFFYRAAMQEVTRLINKREG
ncbi:MAG: hypothetical protein JNJ43_00465 [Anaerolineales bacterium]|nr:hypothetical protein [Anaerolineales bacterium]